MIFAAVANAFNLHYIHGLAGEVNTFVNMHYSHLGFMITSGLLCNFSPLRVTSNDLTWGLLFLLIGIVFTGFLAQLLVFMANIIKKPSVMMPFGYICVIAGFWADLYLFGTSFELINIIGIVLTSVGLLSEFLKNYRADKVQAN